MGVLSVWLQGVEGGKGGREREGSKVWVAEPCLDVNKEHTK